MPVKKEKDFMSEEMKKHIREILDKKNPILIIVVHRDGTEWWGSPRDIVGTCEYVKNQIIVEWMARTRAKHPPQDKEPSSYHL